jgi:hypothetical protein
MRPFARGWTPPWQLPGSVQPSLIRPSPHKPSILVQPISPPVNHHLIELLTLADACAALGPSRDNSIRRATALMAISRSWRVPANQLDRPSEIEKDEGEEA